MRSVIRLGGEAVSSENRGVVSFMADSSSEFIALFSDGATAANHVSDLSWLPRRRLVV